MTPRELIEMLSKWHLDEEFEVRVVYAPPGGIEPVTILNQGLNSINLSREKD